MPATVEVPADSAGSAPPTLTPVLTPPNPVPAIVVPLVPIPLHKFLIWSKPTPCSAPDEMDMANFCLAMECLFDAAGFGLNASSENSCPATTVTEEAGTQRPIINISAARENKCWLAPVDNARRRYRCGYDNC
jgi:hypothetical protein